MFEPRLCCRLFVPVSLTVLVLAAGCTNLSSSHYKGDGINRQNFERLQAGMTEKQVEAVFGVPAGYYGGFVTHPFGPDDPRFKDDCLSDRLAREGVILPAARARMWVGQHGWAVVAFDRSGNVIPTGLTFSDPRVLNAGRTP
jgi:hypothetical protein